MEQHKTRMPTLEWQLPKMGGGGGRGQHQSSQRATGRQDLESQAKVRIFPNSKCAQET